MKHRLLHFCLTALFFLCGCGDRKTVEDNLITVRTGFPVQKTFVDSIETQGVVESVDHCSVSARTPAVLEKIHVKEGDRVRKGEVLFQSDKKNLENRKRLAVEALHMAMERLNTKELEGKIAKVQLEKAELDWARSRKLFVKEAVSKNAHEKQQVTYESAQFTYQKAAAAISTAKAEVDFAKATLNIAEKHLADAEVYAPYDAIVTAKLKNEQEFCGPGTSVLNLERENGKKRIAAVIAGIHFPRIRKESAKVIVSFGTQCWTVPLTYLSDTLDPLSRTIELKADLPEKIPLPSGTLCKVKLIVDERNSPALPEEAILLRKNGRSAVFVLEKDHAKEVTVETGLSQNGWTELRNPKALNGCPVIVSGQYFVQDGVKVRCGK